HEEGDRELRALPVPLRGQGLRAAAHRGPPLPRRSHHVLIASRTTRRPRSLDADSLHLPSGGFVSWERPRAARPGSSYRLHMKLKGTIRRSDLEGGHWVLETDSGERYQLTGSLGGCKDGQAVEVEGKVDKNAIGIGMTGPHLAVQKITARS